MPSRALQRAAEELAGGPMAAIEGAEDDAVEGGEGQAGGDMEDSREASNSGEESECSQIAAHQ